MKKILCLLLAALTLLALPACGKKATYANEGYLTMATNAEFPPYEYHDGGSIVGIDAEVAAAIAKKLGLELKIEDMEFDSVIDRKSVV